MHAQLDVIYRHVLLNNEKMSKSTGNFKTLRQVLIHTHTHAHTHNTRTRTRTHTHTSTPLTLPLPGDPGFQLYIIQM